MNATAAITVTPILVADLFVEGERMPVAGAGRPSR
jgi:hypothetical protein